MSGRGVAYAALLGGGVLGLIAGSQAPGLSRALAGAALAGALLLLTLRVRGRQVAGAALALLGAGLVVAGVLASATPAGWRATYAIAGLLVVGGAIVTILTSPRWAPSGERFRTSDEPADLWRAQDAGLDPTAEPHDPDVQNSPPRDTMKKAEQAERPSRRK